MVVYKCSCTSFKCHTSNDITYWKKIYDCNNNISWYHSSWFCKRATWNNTHYLRYIWGSTYESISSNCDSISISFLQYIGFSILLLFNHFIQ